MPGDRGGGPQSERLWQRREPQRLDPHTTAMTRMLGQSYLRSISVRVQDEVALAAAEDGISRLLRERHGAQDFFVLNTDSIRQAITSTNATLTLLIAMIALISWWWVASG